VVVGRYDAETERARQGKAMMKGCGCWSGDKNRQVQVWKAMKVAVATVKYVP
jgi:hypothetical protein